MLATKKSRIKNYKLGIFAEACATIYLRCKLYRIVARRMRNHFGEIDIIALRGNCLICIEVKTRSSKESLDEVLTAKQKNRIINAAASFIARHPEFSNHYLRFDLMLLSPYRWPIHITNAWQAN